MTDSPSERWPSVREAGGRSGEDQPVRRRAPWAWRFVPPGQRRPALASPDQFQGAPERELSVLENDLDLAALGELALDEALGKRVLDVPLDRPAQRPRAVGAVLAGRLDQPGVDLLVRDQANLSVVKGAVELLDHQPGDVEELF